MGWEHLRLALEYEGEHHRTPQQFAKDIARYETMTNELAWIVIRITGRDTPGGILGRLASAWARRTCDQGEKVAWLNPNTQPKQRPTPTPARSA